VLLATLAATLLLVPMAVTTFGSRPVEWRRESGGARRACGVSGGMYWCYSLVRYEDGGPLPGETGSASKGVLLAKGSFGPFNWVHSQRDNYYGQAGPSNELDLGDLSRYRRVTAETRADYWMDALDCAAVLLAPAALVLLNALRRYITHGYWFAGRP
jgi:hypothetical protein